jgi:hypothetical protein
MIDGFWNESLYYLKVGAKFTSSELLDVLDVRQCNISWKLRDLATSGRLHREKIGLRYVYTVLKPVVFGKTKTVMKNFSGPRRIDLILNIMDKDPYHPEAINHYWSLSSGERIHFARQFLNGRMDSFGNKVIFAKGGCRPGTKE